MTQDKVLREIKYKISSICLNKLLNEGKITTKEFKKADAFLRQKYKINFSSVDLLC